MIKKIKNSLAFRLPILYQLVLLAAKAKKLSEPGDACPDYNLLIMCGSKQLRMLTICLKSIFRKFTNLPHIFLVADRDADLTKCERIAGRFPGKRLTVISANECLEYHGNNKALVAFGTKNPMGLKLAAILQILAKGKPLLYCDTDVIWYGDPFLEVTGHLKRKDFQIAMSEDFQPAYDPSLIETGQLDSLLSPPYFCAGILLINGLSEESHRTLQKLISIAQHTSNHFTEQTIFAYLNKQTDNLMLEAKRFELTTSDQFELRPRPKQGVLARHYIGPVRHLFWRDALWIR